MAVARRPFLLTPASSVVAVAWIWAVPWLVAGARGVVWSGAGVGETVVYLVGFWVFLPAVLAACVGERPTRPWVAAAVYVAIGAIPFLVPIVIVALWGNLTADLVGSFLVEWAVTAAVGVAFGWIELEAATRMRQWTGPGRAGPLWGWRPRTWWAVSLTALVAACLAAPILVLVAGSAADAALATALIIAAVTLVCALNLVDIGPGGLALVVVLSIPVIVVSISMPTMNAPLVLALVTAMSVLFAVILIPTPLGPDASPDASDALVA